MAEETSPVIPQIEEESTPMESEPLPVEPQPETMETTLTETQENVPEPESTSQKAPTNPQSPKGDDVVPQTEEQVPPPAQVEEPEVVPEKIPTPPPPKPQVNIIVKTPKEKQTISVDEDAKVEDLKKIAAEKFVADPDYLCLIFAGKLMEDDETLQTLNIKDGMTIHLIIKTAPREPEPGPQRPPADISQTPFGFGNIGGLAGLESLGMGASNFTELQNRLQTELISNPELLKRVLENPLVNILMQDLDSMKTLVLKNPQMKELIQRHPEIKQMLNNKELLRSTAELAKNPSMLQELMRSSDNGLDMEPTGFNSLPNVYNSFQTPRGYSEAKEKVEASQSRSQNVDIFNNPQMASLLQQMTENPRMVQTMLNAPYTQAMLQALAADPSMATALVQENPWYQGNKTVQDYVASMMPQMVHQLQNPEILNMMTNTQAVNALLQIQEGMTQLQNVAPGLVGNLGLGPFANFTDSETTPVDSPENTETKSDAKESSDKQSTSQNLDNFSQFMSRMVKGMHCWGPKAPPSDKFHLQLEYLRSMGFTNDEKNLQMLTANFGDINTVVQKLLLQNQKEYGLKME